MHAVDGDVFQLETRGPEQPARVLSLLNTPLDIPVRDQPWLNPPDPRSAVTMLSTNENLVSIVASIEAALRYHKTQQQVC